MQRLFCADSMFGLAGSKRNRQRSLRSLRARWNFSEDPLAYGIQLGIHFNVLNLRHGCCNFSIVFLCILWQVGCHLSQEGLWIVNKEGNGLALLGELSDSNSWVIWIRNQFCDYEGMTATATGSMAIGHFGSESTAWSLFKRDRFWYTWKKHMFANSTLTRIEIQYLYYI